MWIVKRKNRRSDKERNSHFYRIGGESQTDTAGAVVMDLEMAADVMTGAFADRIRVTHAEAVAAQTISPAHTLWAHFGQRAAGERRSAPLAEIVRGDLLDRRFEYRGTNDRRAPVLAKAS